MRRRLTAIFVLAISLLLAGCNGALETDEVAWVFSLGIDKADDGDLLLSYRIAVPSAVAGSGGEGGGGEKRTSGLLTIKAPTLAEGRNLLNTVMSRSVNLTHTTAIVIGEDLARAGVQDLIGPLMRYRDFRGTIFLVVARGKARDVMMANKPEIDTLVSRWVENYMRSATESGYYLPINLHEFYQRLKTMTGAPLALGFAVNPLTGEDRSAQISTGEKANAYLPGEMPRLGGNPAEFVGTAVFKGDKLIGFLTTEETRALAILLDQFPRGLISVEDPLDPQRSVSLGLRNGSEPKIRIDISGERPRIDVVVYLEGEVTSIPSGVSYESPENRAILEDRVAGIMESQITNMLLHTRSWGTDVVNFGYHARPQFATIQEMTDYHWDTRYAQADFTVKVTFIMRHTGLMRKSAPMKGE